MAAYDRSAQVIDASGKRFSTHASFEDHAVQARMAVNLDHAKTQTCRTVRCDLQDYEAGAAEPK